MYGWSGELYSATAESVSQVELESEWKEIVCKRLMGSGSEKLKGEETHQE